MTTVQLRPLDVEADLVIESGGATAAHLRSTQGDLRLDVTSASTRALSAPLGGPLAAARRLSDLGPSLDAADLRLEVLMDGRTIAVAGRDARPLRLLPRDLHGVELRLATLARIALGGNLMSRVAKAKLLICLAAFASFLFSVYLWFMVDKEQGLFVGIWVPSILSLGAVLLGGRGGRDE